MLLFPGLTGVAVKYMYKYVTHIEEERGGTGDGLTESDSLPNHIHMRVNTLRCMLKKKFECTKANLRYISIVTALG